MIGTWCTWHSHHCEGCWVQDVTRAAKMIGILAVAGVIGFSCITFAPELDNLIERLAAAWNAVISIMGGN